MVVDHLGKPALDEAWDSPATRQWLTDLSQLAREPNTLIKLSGVEPAHSIERAHPFVSAALETFGPSRCMVGSDWPVSRRAGEPYEAWFDHVATSFGLSEVEQELVLWRNAATTYRIELG
jgi:L-fuconolactonase